MLNPNKDTFTLRQTMQRSDFECYHYLDPVPPVVDFHEHEFYEVFFFLSGDVNYIIEGRTYQLRPGDILLTDIRFGPGEPDGIELVRRHFPFGSRTQVIYVTGDVEYCTSVYRTDHVYFLTKPVSQCDLHDALDKALARLETVSDFALGVRSGGVLLSLPVSQIVFVESDRRKIRIHTTDKGVVETYAALRSLRERLPRMFIQCHQSFLVNAEYVSEFREKSLLLRTGDVVPVSQKKRRTAREAFFTYLREGA